MKDAFLQSQAAIIVDLYCLCDTVAAPVSRRSIQLCGVINYRPTNRTTLALAREIKPNLE